jgi:hypothetical protein
LSRAVDAFALVLFAASICAFGVGIHALGEHEDFKAVYLLIVGALAIRASTDLLRPRGGTA